MHFYKCDVCGKVHMSLENDKIPTICCGKTMKELEANIFDASEEKHIPFIEEKDNSVFVRVGETMHPSTEEHHICFIILHTDQGYKVKHLKSNDQPVVQFAINDNEIIFSCYAYCNLHGLWKKSID